ncbi:hypothetical protein AMATHDRAFT_3205 [Amanita thiersii Skay4041]|uniref:Uncharacterized protein n=1 Tax=Amanita thiersii Skay4041 TaxID=703135 RepID=A0A2A9NU53_9AGAR|nr:hypothetical protein AMATHDRAFT_3205 [Amanita thiersii Skay4041]
MSATFVQVTVPVLTGQVVHLAIMAHHQSPSQAPANILTGWCLWSLYSRWANNRRLESHTYGLWNTILFQLIKDLRYCFVSPQFILQSQPEGNEPTYPRSSADTEPTSDVNELKPDFCINTVELEPRGPLPQPATWDMLKVQSYRIILILELKRIAPRQSATQNKFLHELMNLMTDAASDVIASATMAFNGDQALEQVILMARSGEWWTWRQCTRQECLAIKLGSTSSESPSPPESLGKRHVESDEPGPDSKSPPTRRNPKRQAAQKLKQVRYKEIETGKSAQPAMTRTGKQKAKSTGKQKVKSTVPVRYDFSDQELRFIHA